MYTFLADNLGLVHLLHGVQLPVLLHHHGPHLAEAALSDHVLELKMVATHLGRIDFALALLLDYYLVLFLALARQLG